MKQISSFTKYWQNSLDPDITASPAGSRLRPLVITSSNNGLSQRFACLRQNYHQKVIKVKKTILIIVEYLEKWIEFVLDGRLFVLHPGNQISTKGLFLQHILIRMDQIGFRMLQEAFDKVLDVLWVRKLLLLLLWIGRYEIIKYCFWEEVLQFGQILPLIFNFQFKN